LCDRQLRNNPSENVRVLVQTALDSIYGVDINPYAIAIARFRLLLAAMKASDITRLLDAPNFKIHLVCGDSLLYGSPKGDQLTTGWHVLDEVMMAQDAAALLLQFFQKIDANTGLLVHDFTDPNWDTRFLGDLYQDLSEAVRKQYALLQTPDFVEAFILDRTLEPAIAEFGLDDFKMIDPACGSAISCCCCESALYHAQGCGFE